MKNEKILSLISCIKTELEKSEYKFDKVNEYFIKLKDSCLNIDKVICSIFNFLEKMIDKLEADELKYVFLESLDELTSYFSADEAEKENILSELEMIVLTKLEIVCFDEPSQSQNNKKVSISENTTDKFFWEKNEFIEYIEDFYVECDDIITSANESFLELEENQSLDVINKIFRGMHTLKGSAGMMGLMPVSELAHIMENVLDDLRKEKYSISDKIVDILFDGLDKIKLILTQTKTTDEIEVKNSKIIENLKMIREQKIDEIQNDDAKGEPQKQETKSLAVTNSEIPKSFQKKSGVEKKENNSIRINSKKIDDIINMVSELVIGKIRLENQLNNLKIILSEYKKNLKDFSTDKKKTFEKIYQNNLNSLNEVFKNMVNINFIVKDLQESAMKTRMLPIGTVFAKFRRTVRDLSKKMNKRINLQIIGEETEIDKSVIEKIGDPLMHLIRNSIDHGIELPEDRIKVKKSEIGTITLKAEYRGNQIIIEIIDDGNGISVEKIKSIALKKNVITEEELKNMSKMQILKLIFKPGFSTAEKVTNISGRGVGMDVVKSNISHLRGIIDIESEEGKGSKFIIKLPLTLAIIQILTVKCCEQEFAIPLSNISETLTFEAFQIKQIKGNRVFNLRGSTVPLISLSDTLKLNNPRKEKFQDDVNVVIIGLAEERLGIIVDEFLEHQEIVIKSLGNFIEKIKFVSGATITGSGDVLLILDTYSIMKYFQEN